MEADWSGFDVVSIRRHKFPYFIRCFLRYYCTGVQPERKRLRELQPPGALLLNKSLNKITKFPSKLVALLIY